MHFAVQKDVLVKALRDVSNAIATRVVQPVLSNVLIESVDNVTLRFTGTDLDLTIRSTVPSVVYAEGKITLPGKKLLEVVSKLPSDLVSFQVNQETQETTVSCQKSKFTLLGLSAADFPSLGERKNTEGFLMPTEVLRRSIIQTSFAAAAHEVGSILGGVYLFFADGAFESTATDSSRLAHRHELLNVAAPVGSKTDGDKETESKAGTATLEKPRELKAIVPARACTEFLKIFDGKEPGERVRVAVFEGQISFESDSHLVLSRLIGGEYPRYHELFPADFSNLAVFKREEMLSALDRVAVMSDDRTNLIKLHFEAESVQISSNTPDLGKAQEEVACSFEGQPIDIAVNVRYVMDVLQKLPAEELRLEMTGALKPLIFKAADDDNYKYLLMPVQAR